MALLTDCSAESCELERLSALLPMELRADSRVTIVRSTEVTPSLIATERTNQRHRFRIQIDLSRWQELQADQRNLLLWHEVARIQNKTVPRFALEMPVIVAGLGLALTEVAAQNVISLSAILVGVALAGHQLYQRNRGERCLREMVAADRRAIQLATQSGYAFSQAVTSLYDALKVMSKFARKAAWQRYQVRLRVLEILVQEQDKQLVDA
jgi:hypothetical protein